MKKVLIIGGQGTASVIGDSIIHANNNGYNEYEFVGFVNDYEEEINSFPVIGILNDINKLIKEGYYFIFTLYKIGMQDERIKLFRDLNIPENRLCTFVHPSAYVAPSAKLNPGSVVLANASISSQANIGKCCLIMNNVSIGHDNKIGNHNFFAAKSTIGSFITTGRGAWFGLNCTINGKICIGNKSTVGSGAVVTKDIPDNQVWVGNPASNHKKNSGNLTIT